jgi:hypothetical protein
MGLVPSAPAPCVFFLTKKERWRIKDGPLEEACEFVAGIYFAF